MRKRNHDLESIKAMINLIRKYRQSYREKFYKFSSLKFGYLLRQRRYDLIKVTKDCQTPDTIDTVVLLSSTDHT